MRSLFVLVIMALSGLSVSAQDIIKLKKGEELQVKVLKVTPSYIEYSYPNEDAVIQIQRKNVASIHYESGRVEEFAPVKPQSIEEKTDKEVKAPKSFNSPLAKKQMFYVKAGLALNKIHFYDENYSLLGIYRRFKTGEALDLGYSRYIKDTKFYWAAELGLTTRGCYYDLGDVYLADTEDIVIKGCYKYVIHHGIKVAPVILGYRFMLPRDFAIDLRLGGHFTYYYAGKMAGTLFSLTETGDKTYYSYTWNAKSGEDNYDPYFKKQRRYNAGLETGVAFWYKRFCFDFTYNVGFVSFDRTIVQPEDMSTEEYLDELNGYTNNLKWEVMKKNYNYNIQFKLGIAF